MLQKLERKLGRFAIPQLTLYLVAGQVGAWVLSRAKPDFANRLLLVPRLVLEGEPWRVVSFLFTPPSSGDGTIGGLFLIFALLLLYTFGRALEEHWGEFRYNVFVLTGWLASVGASFVSLDEAATNIYLMESIFLAFAYLNPDYTIRLFFILPVKVRWLAWLVWLWFAFTLAMGTWQDRALVVAGTLNFFLFFGPDIVLRIRGVRRRSAKREEVRRAENTARHTCASCGVTDLDDPVMQFRYCSKCAGSRGYCIDHIRDHEHVRG